MSKNIPTLFAGIALIVLGGLADSLELHLLRAREAEAKPAVEASL